MSRLIGNEETYNSTYELFNEQINAVEEAQKQFMNGLYLKSDQADKEIEEWFQRVPECKK